MAAEPRSRGHEIAFANPAPAPSRLIASAGFANLEVPPISVIPTKLVEPTPLVRDVDHFLALLGFCDHEFTAAQVNRWMTVLAEWRPDAVLDSMGVACCAAARISQIPVIEILQGDFHPDGPGFTWWLPAESSPTPVDAFNAVLAGGGVAPVDRAGRLLLKSATVVVGSPSTDPVPDPSLKHVGLLGWGDSSANLPAAIPAPGRRPLVFLYGGKPRYRPGTVFWGDSAIVLDASLKALAPMDVDVVLGGGGQELPDGLPSNVTPLEYAPGQALAKRADVMIHHGGHGSTLTALAAGTPALVIPTYSERESNGRRVTALGAGLCLVPDRVGIDQWLDSGSVRDAIGRLLEESQFRVSAAVAAHELAALPGAAHAADAVELTIQRAGKPGF